MKNATQKRFMKKSMCLCLTFAFVITGLFSYNVSSAAKKVTVKSVKITNPKEKTLVLAKGKSFSLKTTVKVKPNKAANKKVTYKSSKPKIVSVSSKGKLKAKKYGTATIKVTSKKNKKKSATVTVKVIKPVESITLNTTTTENLAVGGNPFKLTATVAPADATTPSVYFVSSDPSIATVTQDGVVTAVGTGTVQITALALDGSNIHAIATFNVTDYDKVNYEWKSLPSLKDTYKNDFLVGVAVDSHDLFFPSQVSAYVKYQFNSMTMGNEMKPMSLYDGEGSEVLYAQGSNEVAVKTDRLDKILSYAHANNIKLRFHTLLWHAQTYEAFFSPDFNSEGLASKEVMDARLKSYITKIITYCETKYPGVIYAYDVANEALHCPKGFTDALGNPVRNWWQIYNNGKTNAANAPIAEQYQYVVNAFKYAKEALNATGSKAKLYYNDFSEYQIVDQIKQLVAAINKDGKYIDGVGMQSHIGSGNNSPTILGATIPGTYEYAIVEFAKLGDVQVTELDISVNNGSQYKTLDQIKQDANGDFAQQGKRFQDVMSVLQKHSSSVSSVTFWGVQDGESSWIPEGHVNLVTEGFTYLKPAFYGALQKPFVK